MHHLNDQALDEGRMDQLSLDFGDDAPPPPPPLEHLARRCRRLLRPPRSTLHREGTNRWATLRTRLPHRPRNQSGPRLCATPRTLELSELTFAPGRRCRPVLENSNEHDRHRACELVRPDRALRLSW